METGISLTERQDTFEQIRRDPGVSVLIVGGGINGAGLFRELALQGIDVVLAERSDFCSGASAASSRMIHGGLRYLEFGEFRLVRESLNERNLLLRNAPHYVHPLPTTIPLSSRFSGIASCLMRFFRIDWARPAHRGILMVKLGLTFYDVFTRKNVLRRRGAPPGLMPRHRFTPRAQALARRPLLNPDTICTATYHDAWISYPERLCLEVLMDGEALCPQARALNYVALESGSGDSVVLRDTLSNERVEVNPRIVVNATGAWIDFANRSLGHETTLIGGTKGAHLVLDHPGLFEALDGEMIYYETPDGRVSVALPWLGKALIGSTDIRIDNPDDARCEEDEMDYILGAITEAFPKLHIDRTHIVSHFSGVRPLPYTKATSTVQISRDHHCTVIEPTETIHFPIYAMIGGKWTTFRGFSEQVATQILERLGQARRADSSHLAIGGGKDFPEDDKSRHQWIEGLIKENGLEEERAVALLERYGTRAREVARFLAEGADQPLRYHEGYSRREIAFIVRNEAVVHLDDLVLRRTAIALLGELTPGLLEELAAIMAPIRQWNDDTIRQEVGRALDILRERHGIDFPSAGQDAD